MDFLNGYVVIVVLGICTCFGFIIKYAVPSESINKFIPLIMGTLGVLINLWVNSFAFTPEILLGGLASGLASTGAYEAVRNMIEYFRGDKK